MRRSRRKTCQAFLDRRKGLGRRRRCNGRRPTRSRDRIKRPDLGERADQAEAELWIVRRHVSIPLLEVARREQWSLSPRRALCRLTMAGQA